MVGGALCTRWSKRRLQNRPCFGDDFGDDAHYFGDDAINFGDGLQNRLQNCLQNVGDGFGDDFGDGFGDDFGDEILETTCGRSL